MATEIMKFECPMCHKLISLDGVHKFCPFCGCKLENKDIKTLTLPICPQGIPKGNCDICEKGRHKECDDCGGTEEVKYRPEWGDKCLCKLCREREATLQSLQRSW